MLNMRNITQGNLHGRTSGVILANDHEKPYVKVNFLFYFMRLQSNTNSPYKELKRSINNTQSKKVTNQCRAWSPSTISLNYCWL